MYAHPDIIGFLMPSTHARVANRDRTAACRIVSTIDYYWLWGRSTHLHYLLQPLTSHGVSGVTLYETMATMTNPILLFAITPRFSAHGESELRGPDNGPEPGTFLAGNPSVPATDQGCACLVSK